MEQAAKSSQSTTWNIQLIFKYQAGVIISFLITALPNETIINCWKDPVEETGDEKEKETCTPSSFFKKEAFSSLKKTVEETNVIG